MSKFEKSRGLYLKQHYYFCLLRGKETASTCVFDNLSITV